MHMLELTRRNALVGGLATLAASPISAGAQTRSRSGSPPPIGAAERKRRLSDVQQRMQSLGIGALVIESGPALDYFTGIQWHRSERPTMAVVPASGAAIIITPFFERPSVSESLQLPLEIRPWQEDQSPYVPVADYLKSRGVGALPIAFEETTRAFIVDGVRRLLPTARLADGAALVRPIRMRKSAAELALMQHASDITIKALKQTHAQVKLGESNHDIAARFERIVGELGGSDTWALVLIDEAAALPHGSGRPQEVKRGSIVLMDCGCAVHGYQSDISRTFVFSADPTPEQRKVWGQVRQGQAIAFAAARVGAPAGTVDDAVRRQYEAWGYGPGYALPGLSHRTGHGIGMEGHEPVNLVHGETTALAPGMCFSNEPGIYIPGKFGVRLEDCFHMTATGPAWFSVPPPSIDQPFA
ncbi:Xaa-Pro peptidase family protein [Sphingomonas sp. KRR8]|uniref:M24 family metallopeptidase n=1 Tax=Sphingomonas sp. KRR8 TaxID=2942996 RepID=UPI002020C8BF|nr:Xaa-Pro peptidase family protein [Sphingomonas sp. KRR8]URD62413.1 Xaa-Pro peptidase family protein [Sphingomonas sp. KRR8]